ncbi:MAG: HPr(Ser) kinase/phosphatase [Clostridia bacterium]|nr:HPr(Ser) kinase/phosphatase [Clostridia bacterium]
MKDINGETLMLEKFANDLHLEILYAGRGMLTINSMSVYRPGLQLAGFFNFFDSARLIVIGLSEYEYLRSFSIKERKARLAKLFSFGDIPGIIVCRALPLMPELIEQARKNKCPIFRSIKATTAVITDLTIYLNKLLAPTTTIHGVLMEVFGVGVLLTGNSGVGKSETAMELIKRGHRLVADDNVVVKKVASELVGTAPEAIRYFMEIRGIGIINVKSMYGSGSILNEKSIDLVIEMETWKEDNNYDRLGTDSLSEEILGVKVDKYVVPVRPGRNLAIIIEVAARNHRLKEMGYDATQELIARTIGR